MPTVLRKIDIGGSSIVQGLVRSAGVVFELPEFQSIFSFLRTDEPFPVEQFVVVGPIASLHNAVLPGTARADGSVQQVQFQDHATIASYDASPDGQRFLMLKTVEHQEQAATEIHVVLNWFEELKRRVPVR